MQPVRAFLVHSTLCLLASAARAGTVHVVDASGGGAYTQIQPAVNAADDGDLVLVKAGSYAGFTIGGKGIAVVADAGTFVSVDGAAVVRNVGAGKVVVLSGLSIFGSTNSTASHGDGLYVENCAAAVRVERCNLNGAYAPALSYELRSRPGAEVITSSNVAFVGSTLRGITASSFYAADGGDGIDLSSSSASFYDCTIIGGTGRQGGGCQSLAGGAGGHGIRTATTFVFASHSSFSGGNGGAGAFHDCGSGFPDGGNGGNGVTLAWSSQAYVVQCVYAHGTGGMEGEGYGLCATCPGDPGQDGINLDIGVGTQYTMLPVTARQMIAASPVREGMPAALQFQGSPGDQVMLLVWSAPVFSFSPALAGVRLVIPPKPMLVWIAGRADASGAYTDSITFPDLGPGVESGLVFIQSLFSDVHGHLYLGSNSSIAVLDSSF